MSLAERLRGVVRASAPAAALQSPPPAERSHAPGLEASLGGTWNEGPDGRCFLVERNYPGESRCGRARVDSIAHTLSTRAGDAAVLAGTAAPSPFVFFDLETTGLNGGAGTVVFLVGCGWFDEGAFRVRQYLLTQFGDERPMLARVAAALRDAGAIVSFNGKSFDAPVLETRYLFHRLPWSPRTLAHLDVLHPARKLWGGYGDGCSLLALERELFGAARADDVPGYQIPARYFQFVRSGDAAPLAPVLEHNRRDLLSLAAVCARALDLIGAGAEAVDTPQEALALGKLYLRARREAAARAALERAAALAHNRGMRFALIRVDSLRTLALLDRRARNYADAAMRWRQVVDTPGCPRVSAREAHEALAIHHEHRARDLGVARSFTLKTLDAGAAWARTRAERARHRLARIDRKIAAAEQAGGLFPPGRSLAPRAPGQRDPGGV